MLRPSVSLWSLACIVAAAAAASEEWTIYHSFGGDFSRRGVLQWNDEESLTPENIQAMLDYGWYHVKIETSENDYVLATVPACHLRRANFKDEFQITLPRSGSSERQITSLSYTPLVSPLAPKTCDGYDNDDDALLRKEAKLLSKAHVELDTPGMTLKTVLPHTKPPPGLAFMANPNTVKNTKGSAGGGGAAGGAGTGGPIPEEPAPQGMEGFLRRYWYVLLPLFLANFMGGGEAPKPEEEGGGAAGDAAPAAAAQAIAAPGASPTKKARRGKKG
jgi:hypothetical protein